MSKNAYDIDWAELIDILAKEYGWTIDYIKSLDLGQIMSLIKAIRVRYDKQNNNEENPIDNELSISDFKAMGGKEKTREDGRKEIVI
jgi:hypothetical protein